jgi:hypothetical protein
MAVVHRTSTTSTSGGERGRPLWASGGCAPVATMQAAGWSASSSERRAGRPPPLNGGLVVVLLQAMAAGGHAVGRGW